MTTTSTGAVPERSRLAGQDLDDAIYAAEAISDVLAALSACDEGYIIQPRALGWLGFQLFDATKILRGHESVGGQMRQTNSNGDQP